MKSNTIRKLAIIGLCVSNAIWVWLAHSKLNIVSWGHTLSYAVLGIIAISTVMSLIFKEP